MGPDDVSAAILAIIAGGSTFFAEHGRGLFNHLTQGLGVVNTNLIHQHGGQGDDAALLMALQAAAGVPRQGMNTTTGTT